MKGWQKLFPPLHESINFGEVFGFVLLPFPGNLIKVSVNNLCMIIKLFWLVNCIWTGKSRYLTSSCPFGDVMRHPGFSEAGVCWARVALCILPHQCLPVHLSCHLGDPQEKVVGSFQEGACRGPKHDTAFLASWVSCLFLLEVNLVPDLN